MVQLFRDNNIALQINSIYLNLYDEMTSLSYPPLIELKSQMTNKTKLFLPYQFTSENFTNKERYLRLRVFLTNIQALENTTTGSIFMGTTEYPYGLYNITIYQNNDATNLVVANTIKTVWKGVANVKSVNNNAVTYTENSSTISSPTYITNTL
jgi:hypothetical protein|tara:strand:- start:198 stop:656 length:459 start_codon:yes stop_codon:yes gene_type:complete